MRATDTSAAISPGAAPGGATGYTLVLPPGWRQVPVRAGTREAIREIVRDRFRVRPGHVPRDALTPYRVALEQQLTAAAAQARKQGGTELYLPVEPVRGTLIAASFVVSEGSLGARDEHDATLILAAVGGDGPGPVLDGARAARIERIAPPDPARGAERGSRHADYAVPVPGGDGRWLVFAFSALSAGDPGDKLAGNLISLFDAIMSTFRWTWSQPPESPA
jgi:hypothetical protein